jgi:hypothetical protein
MIPDLLKGSAKVAHNVIVRPRTASGIEHTSLTTSRPKPPKIEARRVSMPANHPGNYQAWVAVRDTGDVLPFC